MQLRFGGYIRLVAFTLSLVTLMQFAHALNAEVPASASSADADFSRTGVHIPLEQYQKLFADATLNEKAWKFRLQEQDLQQRTAELNAKAAELRAESTRHREQNERVIKHGLVRDEERSRLLPENWILLNHSVVGSYDDTTSAESEASSLEWRCILEVQVTEAPNPSISYSDDVRFMLSHESLAAIHEIRYLMPHAPTVSHGCIELCTPCP